MRRALVIALLFLAAPAAAQIAPAERAEALEDAFHALHDAPTEEIAGRIEKTIWGLWFIGPDAEATRRLDDAALALRSGQLEEARRLLEALVADRPDFAEAWNQLAFAKFLLGDPYGSLSDIDAVLRREPRHFGALAGRAEIERRMGRAYAASKTMGRIGALHPWLARRSAIPADPPPPDPPL